MVALTGLREYVQGVVEEGVTADDGVLITNAAAIRCSGCSTKGTAAYEVAVSRSHDEEAREIQQKSRRP